MYRLLTLMAAATVAASALVTPCAAQNAREATSPPADLHPPINLDADTLRAQLAPGSIGLKPQSSAGSYGLALPSGLDYNRAAKSLIVPLDPKNEWGVGVGLNLNSSDIVELSPNSALNQQTRRTPGLMLHRKF